MPNENGLIQDWGGETVFVNPPYGRERYDWVKKCSEESKIDYKIWGLPYGYIYWRFKERIIGGTMAFNLRKWIRKILLLCIQTIEWIIFEIKNK